MKVVWILILSMVAVLFVGVVARPQEDKDAATVELPVPALQESPADAQQSSPPSQTAINTPPDMEHFQQHPLPPGSKVTVHRRRSDDHQETLKDSISTLYAHRVDKTQDEYKAESQGGETAPHP